MPCGELVAETVSIVNSLSFLMFMFLAGSP